MQSFQHDENPRFRARALWVLGQFPEQTEAVVRQAIGDSDKDLRMAGLRLARRMKVNLIPIVEALVRDPSPQVRRECAVALRHCSDPARFELWRTLALQYDAADRWYLEALGLAADGVWEQCLGGSAEAFLASSGQASGQPSTIVTAAAAADLVWRSRATDSAVAIASLIERAAAQNAPTSAGFARGIPALFRALDFQPAGQVQQAVMALVRSGAAGALHPDHQSLVLSESLQRLDPAESSTPEVRTVLERVLADHPEPSHLISLVGRFRLSERYPEILQLAQTHPAEQSGIEAITLLLELQQQDLLTAALRSSQRELALATVDVMGNSARTAIADPLLKMVSDTELDLELRRAAVRAAARVNPGAQRLLQMAEKKELDADLVQAAAAALHASGARPIREAALKLFPLPPSRDNLPTPPISELTALKGDVTNGRLVFFTSGTCHKCHVVGQMGRDIGPNLTEIGSKLSREAMFESILFPNAGISHNFETWTVVLTSGTTINGLLTSQTDDSVSIKGDDALVRTFDRSEIDELVKQKISLMPADLQKAMSVQEMADVVAFMQTLKKP
jgi:putative heme-binding domain-containing protein